MRMLNKLQIRVHSLLEPAGSGDTASRVVDWTLIVLILLNGLVAILETLPAAEQALLPWFAWFEVVSVAVFSAEYLLRVWSCTANGAGPFRGRLRYMGRPLLVIDLVAILPTYLVFLGLDLRMLRMLRLARIFRLAKLSRYSTALQLMGQVVWSKKEELLLSIVLGFFALIVSATLIYYTEHQAQPEVFSSIPASGWWAVTTLTTVGYGDAYPVTTFGKMVGALVQILGVGFFALPAGILAGSYMEKLAELRNPNLCPHCGQSLGADHSST